ncbi:MAG: sugar transferase, partial [Planctomycetota bacterium]
MMARRPWTESSFGLGFLVAIDLFAIFDAFALGYLLRFHWRVLGDDGVPTPDPVEYIKAWLLGGAMIVTLYHAYGLYKRRAPRDPVAHLSALMRAGSVAVIFILALSYFYRGFSYSRLAVVTTCAVGAVLSGGFRMAWQSYCSHLRAAGRAVVPAILIGSREVPKFLAQRIDEDRSLGLDIVAVADEHEIVGAEFDGLPNGRLKDLPTLLDRTGAREVLIGHPAIQHHQLLEMIQVCESRGIRIRMVPATYDLVVDVRDFEDVGGIPFVTVNEQRSRPLYRIWKRTVDIVASAGLLAVLSPLFAAISFAIVRESGRPVFFRQQRIGRDGRPFSMLKFRSMVADAEARLGELVDLEALDEPVFKLDDDPRVTRVGRWIRRTSLDELP